MKKISKIGLIVVIALTLSISSNISAAPPLSLIDQIKIELELVQNIILEAITGLSTQLSITESTLAAHHDTIEDNTDIIIGKVDMIKLETSQALTEISLVKEDLAELNTGLDTLTANLETIQLSIDSIGIALGDLSTQMTYEHDLLKTELVAAINAQGSSDSEITETTTTTWFGPEINVWNPSDGYSPETNTIYIGSTPKRVSLWIYGWTGEWPNHDAWENWNSLTGTDGFVCWILVNGIRWKYFGLSPDNDEGYLSYVFNPIDDIPMSGEITLEYRRSATDDSLDIDPFVITWFVDG